MRVSTIGAGAGALGVLLLCAHVTLAGDPPPLEGRFVSFAGDSFVLRAGPPTARGGRSARGTLTLRGKSAGCSFLEDNYGNWLFVVDGYGQGGFAWVTPGEQGHIRPPQEMTWLPQAVFVRAPADAGPDWRPPLRPIPQPAPGDPVPLSRARRAGDVLEVRMTFEQSTLSLAPARVEELASFELSCLDRVAAVDSGRPTRVERHVVSSQGAPALLGRGQPARDELEGRTYVLERRGDAWTVGRPGGATLTAREAWVLARCPVADVVPWEAKASSGECRAAPGRAPEGVPAVVRALAAALDAEVKREADLTGTWSVEALALHRRELDLSLRAEQVVHAGGTTRIERRIRFTQETVVPPSRLPDAFVGAGAGAGAGGPPTPAAPALRGIEDGTIEAGLGRAREARQLLVVVFLAQDGGKHSQREAARAVEAVNGFRVEPVRGKFLFLRRPQSDDLGLPTPEATAHRAERSPTFVILDPWADLSKAPPYPPLGVVTDAERLREGLDRAIVEAARAQHPPPPARR